MDIREKILKLLNLADSPNEHEAKAALLRARELMAKYKLQPEELQDSKSIKVINRTIGITCTKMTNAWAVRLSAIIAEHYCCKAYREHVQGEKKVTIGFVGLEEDFEVCVRIYRYAFDCIESRCRAIKADYKGIYAASYLRQIVHAYGNGFCTGLYEAFQEQDMQHEKEWGLVLATPGEVLEVMDTMGKATAYVKTVYDDHSLDFAQEGYEDGKKFDPSRKLERAGRPRLFCRH